MIEMSGHLVDHDLIEMDRRTEGMSVLFDSSIDFLSFV